MAVILLVCLFLLLSFYLVFRALVITSVWLRYHATFTWWKVICCPAGLMMTATSGYLLHCSISFSQYWNDGSLLQLALKSIKARQGPTCCRVVALSLYMFMVDFVVVGMVFIFIVRLVPRQMLSARFTSLHFLLVACYCSMTSATTNISF